MTQHHPMPTIADITNIVADSVRAAGDQIDAAFKVSGVSAAADAVLSGLYEDVAITLQRAMTGKVIRLYDGDFNLAHVVDLADCVHRGHCTFTLPADHPAAQWLWETQAVGGAGVNAAMPTELGQWSGQLREMVIEGQRDCCACHPQRVLVTRWERYQPTFRVLAAQYPNGYWRAFHPATKIVFDLADRDDIKFQMARSICRKSSAPLGDVHVLLDVVSL
ncbi:hypothetical protein ACFRAM_28720, partial [Paenibacillus sp. NPDC056722]|uniref:hypothetical protein n=1 Tax=Paenibacillus sp. NPDC056722 TaxID=3345924 RepID=UPI0036D1609E